MTVTILLVDEVSAFTPSCETVLGSRGTTFGFNLMREAKARAFVFRIGKRPTFCTMNVRSCGRAIAHLAMRSSIFLASDFIIAISELGILLARR